jgi:predicted ATP-grasp superfamily ATP-dependent carboligase
MKLEEFWLRCKNCNRRAKYLANPKDIIYNFLMKKMIFNWDLGCKFCKKPLLYNNLSDTTISELYCYLIAKIIDSNVADKLNLKH